MKKIITLYAVGDNIDTAEYSSWFSKRFLSETEIPGFRDDFDKKELIDSILRSKQVHYFDNEQDALKYAKRQSTRRHIDIVTESPPICTVKAELTDKKRQQFTVTDIVSAKIIQNVIHEDIFTIEEELNYKIPDQSNFLLRAVHAFSREAQEETKGIKVKDSVKNTHFNFVKSYHDEIEKSINFKAAHSFLLVNHRGLSLFDSSFKLPTELRKMICEYVVGEKLEHNTTNGTEESGPDTSTPQCRM